LRGGKTKRVLPQNASHFDTKRLPFWYKTHSVSIRNAPRFATKRSDSLIFLARDGVKSGVSNIVQALYHCIRLHSGLTIKKGLDVGGFLTFS